MPLQLGGLVLLQWGLQTRSYKAWVALQHMALGASFDV
jgi:hypothetical protein